jgi:ribosomal protein S3AE
MKYQKLKDEWDNKEWFCVLKTNDFDNPTIKLSLAFDEEGDAREKYEQIEQLYSILKESAK